MSWFHAVALRSKEFCISLKPRWDIFCCLCGLTKDSAVCCWWWITFKGYTRKGETLWCLAWPLGSHLNPSLYSCFPAEWARYLSCTYLSRKVFVNLMKQISVHVHSCGAPDTESPYLMHCYYNIFEHDIVVMPAIHYLYMTLYTLIR